MDQSRYSRQLRKYVRIALALISTLLFLHQERVLRTFQYDNNDNNDNLMIIITTIIINNHFNKN